MASTHAKSPSEPSQEQYDESKSSIRLPTESGEVEGCSWSTIVFSFRSPVEKGLKKITVNSATYPKATIATIILISVGLLALGIFTNFRTESSEWALWTPIGSYPSAHKKWLDEDSGFPIARRTIFLLFHKDGKKDLFTKEQVNHIYEALDSIRSLPGYSEVCQRQGFDDCGVVGITNFWNNNATEAESIGGDQEVVSTLSASAFPDGTPTEGSLLLGKAVYRKGLPVEAQSISLVLLLPEDEEDETTSYDFEKLAVDAILDLSEKWVAEGDFRVEINADRSFSDEFGRTIAEDIPLVPIVFVIMGVFTSGVFWKRNGVQSRSLLGFMAVVSVLLSIMAGYGLMFFAGVPFTSMTQILPFVFFGVGLDSSFVITGFYLRLDSRRDPIERVEETIDDIGISIFLTSLTSSLAFGLGAITTIPAVLWLVVYAVTTIILIFLWQLTFFIACLVLDERRVQAGSRDCFRWITIAAPRETTNRQGKSLMDNFMERYALILLKPAVKRLVITVFVGLAGSCAISATSLKQAFTFTSVLPSDSYLKAYQDAFGEFSETSGVDPYIYFRGVNQSDISVRQQMDDFVNDLATVEAIGAQPDKCWFRDFNVYVEEAGLSEESFKVQIEGFLGNEVYNKVYKNNIVFDGGGNIAVSRCLVLMDNFADGSVKTQMKALKDQQDVSLRQPVNEDEEELKFFTYDGNYNIWAFYVASAAEITYTVGASIAAVTVVTIVFVPHWTAALFVLPFIGFLYVDLLGAMQWGGIDINPVSYITLVMSIGLLVDFILHILIRYYEVPGRREAKVVETLKSMGSSILIGGITTLLGTLPLAFSASDIFSTFFVSFLAIVTLGVGHGLIFLPVVLSVIGPEDPDEKKHPPGPTHPKEGLAEKYAPVVVLKYGGYSFPSPGDLEDTSI